MTDEEAAPIVSSITWHFMVGCALLSTSQLAEHKRRHGCPACDAKTLPAIAEATLAEPRTS